MSTPPVVPGNLPRLAWDGQTSIFENGVLLAEGERFRQDGNITVADVDLDLLRQERVAMGTFHDNRSNSREGTSYRNVQFSVLPPDDDIGIRPDGRTLSVRAQR
jgi:NAD+ synthase (glutamine-hydrolysing)